MLLIESICLGVVLVYLLSALKHEREPLAFMSRYLFLAATAWIGEDSVIRLYGFYEYSPEWTLFIDRVPLMVLIIWPVVVLSARQLAGYLVGPSRELVPILTGLLVLADASMIEPISVAAGFWHWNAPGIFSVPPIGLLGWAYFAGLSCWRFELQEQRESGAGLGLGDSLVVLIGCHALLLPSWWVFLKWLSQPLPNALSVALALLCSLAVTASSIRRRAHRAVPTWLLFQRTPAALFFFGLLAFGTSHSPALLLYVLAFVPPYMSLFPVATTALAVSRSPL